MVSVHDVVEWLRPIQQRRGLRVLRIKVSKPDWLRLEDEIVLSVPIRFGPLDHPPHYNEPRRLFIRGIEVVAR
jgi:hypothetical protein